MLEILEKVLRGREDLVASTSARAWLEVHRAASSPFELPIDRAIAGAARADRLGFAFASGLHEALRALVPGRAEEELAAFAVTERGGNAPRAIETRLDRDGGGLVLRGDKSFVTFGDEADVFLVAAREGLHDDGRPRLRMIRVAAKRSGVTVTKLPDLGLVPEIAHASIELANVSIGDSDLLEGDGYLSYVKPFRSLEDVYVHAAAAAHLARVSRRAELPRDIIEHAVAAVVALRALAIEDTTAPETHVALAGAIALVRDLVTRFDAHRERLDAATRARWERDRNLLGVARAARDARLAAAWKALDAAE